MAPKARAEDGPLDELFVGDFEGFIGRRNALAKRLLADGDDEGAGHVRGLKKPSRVAWALNQLSSGGPELRDELLDAGAKLRRAQERLVAGKAERAELREAGEREQRAVGRALDAVSALSKESGQALSAPAVEKARATLHAVALDEDVRRDFERHRLTGEHEAAGLEGFSLGAPWPGGKPRGKARPAKAQGKAEERKEAKRRRDELKAGEAELRKLEKREARARQDVERAREAAEHAQRELDRAAKALETATGATTDARERVEELREG